ncbi:MAG: hypothetical protein P8P74_01450 [Crocinitomicaceae bacterium]|nr:hypothetical protein [Crocinitomicaceae bacterium]
MRSLSILLFLFIGFQSCAESERAIYAEYSINSVKSNTRLSQGKSKVVVRVQNTNFSEGTKILYGHKGASFETKLNSKNTFSFVLKSNEYAVQFLPSELVGYKEITTQAIDIQSQTTTYITINFKYAINEPSVVKKPVIYLYPEEKTDVSISINPVGELSFTHPEYNGKWECTATPSGEIAIGDDTYNYLFWEADQFVDKEKLRETSSIVVLKDDLVGFLEGALDKFGFNSKEKMDFITFWAPQMIKHEATEIRFILNEECNQFAELDISPQPNNLLRFYIVWNKTDSSNATSTSNFNIIKPSRDGFTVVEWGGLEISPSSNISLVESTK